MDGKYNPDVVGSAVTVNLDYGISLSVLKCGNVCTMEVNCAVNTAYTAFNVIGVLPAGYRPALPVFIPNTSKTGASTYMLIQTTGALYSACALAAGDVLQGTITYVVGG